MKDKLGAIIAVFVLTAILLFTVFRINRHIYNNKAKELYCRAGELIRQKDYSGAINTYQKLLKFFPKSTPALKTEFSLAEAYLTSGELVKARDVYRNILSQDLDLENAKLVYEKLADLEIKILFSPVMTADSIIYKVQHNDTLNAIAKKYNTTVALIKKANSIKNNIIRPGMNLKITTAKFSIVVDKSDNILTLKSAENVVKSYSVSTGINNSTPTGVFKITNKIVNPPWFSEGKIIPAGSPENVLGSRWLGFNLKSYGLHGTVDDASIGKQCTQGCVRMRNYQVEELYDIVPIGTEVTIID